MQRITLVRYTTKPECAAENEALSRAVFAELQQKKPKGVAYTLLRDGNDFVHLFVNTEDADSAPLVDLPSFKAFSENNAARFATTPDILRLDVPMVDSYGLA
ncbi:MAG: hypothetical protein ACTHPD_07410 [Rhizomicrobium sp.]